MADNGLSTAPAVPDSSSAPAAPPAQPSHKPEEKTGGKPDTTNKSKPPSSAPQTPTKIRRRKGFWATLAACVPCASDNGAHDITPEPARKIHNASEASSLDPDSLKNKEKLRNPSPHPVDASISTTLDVAATNGDTKPSTNSVLDEKDHSLDPQTTDADSDHGDEEEDEEDVVFSPQHAKHSTLPDSETGGVTAGAVQAPGQTETDLGDDMDDDEDRLIMNGGMGIPIGPDGQPQPLLPSILPQHTGRKCLVLDLDETLVHSSFKMIPQADYVIPVLIEHQLHNVYVVKRPGVDQFLEKMGELYEVVVFTASLSMYADPVLDKLDVHKAVTHRLFREHCYNHKGVYVKDLSQLGRPIETVLILDNSPASYIFHPNNAVPVSSWFSDPHDTELTDMCPFLDDLRVVDDVRGILDGGL